MEIEEYILNLKQISDEYVKQFIKSGLLSQTLTNFILAMNSDEFQRCEEQFNFVKIALEDLIMQQNDFASKLVAMMQLALVKDIESGIH